MRWGEAVPYAELARGFPYGGAWIKLVGPQGVFKPKEMSDGPLTLLSTLASTYEDEHLAGAQTERAGVPSPAPSVFSKAYAETVAKARLHQAHFRKETLAAYELRERPLLDAAHIVPDRLPETQALR